MSKRKALDESRDVRDVCAALDRSPDLVEVRQNGTSHRIYKGPRGSVAVPVGHDKELKLGTWRSILRQAAMAGLVCLAVAVVLGALLVL